MSRFCLFFFLLSLTKVCYTQYLEAWVESSENPEELKIWFEDLEANKLDLRAVNIVELAELPFFDEKSAKLLIAYLKSRQDGFDLTGIEEAGFLTKPQREAINRFCIYPSDDFRCTKSKIKFGAIRHRTSDLVYEWKGQVRSDFTRPDKVSGYLYAKGIQTNNDLLQNYFVGIDIPQKIFKPRILLGDYQIESGTGLVFSRGYGQANWLSSNEVLLPPKSSGLYSRPTLSGLSMYRGAALELFHNYFMLNFLFSCRRLDAKLALDGVEEISENQTLSAELENSQKDRLREDLIGIAASTRTGFSEFGIQAYRSHFTPELVPDLHDEKGVGLQGNSLKTGSAYIYGKLKNCFLCSEFAVSDPSGYAYQGSVSYINNAISWVLFKTMSSADFYSPHSKLWGDFEFDANNSSKTGVKLLKTWKNYRLTISGINETTPYGTLLAPLSKSNSNIQADISSSLTPKLYFRLLVNRTYNERTSSSSPSEIYYTDRARADFLIFHNEEYRLRFEIKSSKNLSSSQHHLGTLLFVQSKFTILDIESFLRITQFNAEDHSVNLFTYENTLYGDYPLIQFAGSGSRSALRISRQIGAFRVALKIADTFVKSGDDFHHNGEFAFEVNFKR